MVSRLHEAVNITNALHQGVTPCGASYLLVSKPAVHADRYLNSLFEGRAWPSTDFVSLSPVSFATPQALAAKLSTLTNKRTKGGRGDRDRSQANVSFTTGASSVNELQQVGIDRANFEHNRYDIPRMSG